jgi:hypothetical protein
VVKHRPVHPVGGKGGAEAVARGIEAVLLHSRVVATAGIGVKHFADGSAGFKGCHAGRHGIHIHRVHLFMKLCGFPDGDGAHHGGMVMPVGGRPFKGQLIPGVELATPGFVTA